MQATDSTPTQSLLTRRNAQPWRHAWTPLVQIPGHGDIRSIASRADRATKGLVVGVMHERMLAELSVTDEGEND
jgi:hypothetical protein